MKDGEGAQGLPFSVLLTSVPSPLSVLSASLPPNHALPHKNPDPNAVSAIKSPGAMRPARTHSSSAMGIVAAVVFPYHMMLL